MSLSETYLSRKKLLANNLKSMGVSSVDETDGLTTLINAVLNIEPSIGGLDLDTSLVITTTQESIGLGESIILTSTLRASYDDTTVVDVDLSGVLTGATVKFYNGTTLLGTGITDLNGIATYTYTPSQLGNFTFHTVFEGTENFTNCTSNNVNITVINAPTSLILQADKSILSNYDNDNCTLTATLYDNNNTPMEGLSVVFKNGDIVLATITTNNNGVATYTYNSQGVGDVTITAECMNLVQTYSIEDCNYYNTAEVTRSSTNGSTIYDTNLSQALPTNCEISYDMWSQSPSNTSEHRYFLMPKNKWSSGTTQPTEALYFDYHTDSSGNGQGNFGKRESNSTIKLSDFFNATISTWHTVKYIKEGTTIKMYFDDVLEHIATISWIDNFTDYTLSMMRWRTGGTSKIKNVKFKPLS